MAIVYKPSDIMQRLGIKESLYKKYIAALEDGGYTFQRNQQGHRIFTDNDIQTLETFMDLIKYDGMTIEKVAKQIGKMSSHAGTTEEKQDSHDVMSLVEQAVTTALKAQGNQIHDVMAQNNELKGQLKRMEEKHDRLFMESVRELQEAKKIMLEVQAQIAYTKEKKWWKFWK
jgi:DNA-binding transcriptional MerR regulator